MIKQDVVFEEKQVAFIVYFPSFYPIWYQYGKYHLRYVSFRRKFIGWIVNYGRKKKGFIFFWVGAKKLVEPSPAVNVQYFRGRHHNENALPQDIRFCLRQMDQGAVVCTAFYNCTKYCHFFGALLTLQE